MRKFPARLYLSTREKLEYIKEIIVPCDYKNTTLEDRDKIFHLMEDTIASGSIHFSYRTYFQLLDFYKHDLVNFNVHLKELLPFDNELTMLIEIIKTTPNEKESWFSKFIEITGKSRRTYFYTLAKAKDALPEMFF